MNISWVFTLFSAFLGAFIFYFLRKFFINLKLRRRFLRASLGEVEAESLLEEAGYTLEHTQKSSELFMWVNGEVFSYRVRPDAFATKNQQRFLVEIKTGKLATNPKHTPTRRQLLEYFHGFDVDGILLIDADMKKIHQIHFKPPQESPWRETLKAPDLIAKKKVTSLFWMFVLGFIAALIMVFLCR